MAPEDTHAVTALGSRAPARDATEVRENVLAAAAALLHEQGAGALTVRGIAVRAGTSTMAIYHHYDGKYGVVDELARAGFVGLRASLEAARTGKSALADLRSMLDAYRRTAVERPAVYGLMFTRVVPGYHASDATAQEASAGLAVFVDVMRSAVAAGQLDVEPERGARVLWATAHGLLSLAVPGHPALLEARPELYRAGIEAVLAGFAPSAGVPRHARLT